MLKSRPCHGGNNARKMNDTQVLNWGGARMVAVPVAFIYFLIWLTLPQLVTRFVAQECQ